jgi:hypothetical protein
MDAGLGHAFPRFLALRVRKVRQLDRPDKQSVNLASLSVNLLVPRSLAYRATWPPWTASRRDD